MTLGWRLPSPNAHLPLAVIVAMIPRAAQAHDETREESGMEKLLNSLAGTIVAGFVLTLIVAVVLHAIR